MNLPPGLHADVSVDPACYTLADHFLAAALVESASPPEQAARDRKSLAETIQQAVEDWFASNAPSCGDTDLSGACLACGAENNAECKP